MEIKSEMIRERTREEYEKREQPSWKRNHRKHQTENKFIARSIKKPGRTRRFLERKYGAKAFNEDGTIKLEYLHMAQRYARRTHQTSLLEALNEAETLKAIKKEAMA